MSSPYGTPSFRQLRWINIAVLVILVPLTLKMIVGLPGAENLTDAGTRTFLTALCLYAGWRNLRSAREMRLWEQKAGPDA